MFVIWIVIPEIGWCPFALVSLCFGVSVSWCPFEIGPESSNLSVFDKKLWKSLLVRQITNILGNLGIPHEIDPLCPLPLPTTTP